LALSLAHVACVDSRPADLILTNGRLYTFTWDDPATDGTPAANAPYDAEGWHPDAEAIAVRDDEILFVGSAADAEAYGGTATEVVDLNGASVIPGLVDSHVHVVGLGATLEEVDLVGVTTEEEAVRRVAARAVEVPAGEWIVGWGWDEGAWANRYPDMALLSARVPDHPVSLRSLHGFAVWGNRLAFERAGITAESEPPVGGEIRRDRAGNPTGVLVNRAVQLLAAAVPPVTAEQVERRVVAGLTEMAAGGYVAVHEAGAGSDLMRVLERLAEQSALPIRVYAMLSGRDEALARAWEERGPLVHSSRMLAVHSVKAFYDGALGSRGARLLEDYSDQPGHRGVSGDQYGFDEDLIADLMVAGFQAGIHAIGDAGNRETLDFLERVLTEHPDARRHRHRVEHAQVLHPDDIPRFAELDVIASMEPPHAVEDKTWAEDRLGPERVRHAYAWRSLRQANARLTFNSDLAGSDHDIFYGLHAAVTRRDKEGEPTDGWYPEQRVTTEEALRAYTVWAAYAGFAEEVSGVLAPGHLADITVMDIDPLTVGTTEPGRLLDGSVVLTVVGGRVVYRAP
jgi:predicted amidohydrolase YtcJ